MARCRSQGYFYQGGQGGIPPLNFNNPKRFKIWYVACGTIIRRVVAAAKCKSSVIDLLIFLNVFFGCFVRSLDPWSSHAVYRKVHNCGPFNLLYTWTSEPCSILKGPQFFQKVQNLSKRSKISNVPPPLGNMIQISLVAVIIMKNSNTKGYNYVVEEVLHTV